MTDGGDGPSSDGWSDQMEKVNTEQHELSIEELDAASGGTLYQPLIVVAIATATAIKIGIESLVHKLIH
jgi:hypothetical protein